MEHLAFHLEETRIYEKVAFDAKDPESGVVSITVDGAASYSHTLPKVEGRKPKGLPEWPQKLQGILQHGKAVCLFNLFHAVKSGANMMLTTLLRALQLTDLQMKGFVYLKVDGGSENWNIFVLAVLDLLFDLYPDLKELTLSRFGVGHTHADLDRLFGYLNHMLFGTGAGGSKRGRNVYTREEYVRLLRCALSDKKDTMLLDTHIEDLLFTYDFKSFLAPHLNTRFSGYGSSGQIHVFRFKRLSGQSTPHISYKYWTQSSVWPPEDGSSLKILNTRPNLLNADVKVSPYVISTMMELPSLQKRVIKWLRHMKDMDFVSELDMEQWRCFFRRIPPHPTSTFDFLFPGILHIYGNWISNFLSISYLLLSFCSLFSSFSYRGMPGAYSWHPERELKAVTGSPGA